MAVSKARELARLRAFTQRRGPKPKKIGASKVKSKSRTSKYDQLDMELIVIAERTIKLGFKRNAAVRLAVDAVKTFGCVRLPSRKKLVCADWRLLHGVSFADVNGVQDYSEDQSLDRDTGRRQPVPVEFVWDDILEAHVPVALVDFGGRALAKNRHVDRIVRKMRAKK